MGGIHPAVPPRKMKVGFNYQAYNLFGAQIGPNPHVPADVWERNNNFEAAGNLSAIPLPPTFDHVDRNLKNLRRMGVEVVRWFLLANGLTYGPPPKKRSGRIDFDFTPPPAVDKRFRRDFTELLERVRRAEMQIIPSLISFEFGSFVKYGRFVNWDGGVRLASAGRADVINDPAKRKVFLDTILAELLAASVGYEKQIYAWEVVNEPVWLCLPVGALSSPEWLLRRPEVPIPSMINFLNDALTLINKAGFPSTVGHRFFSDLKRFPAGTVPQFHYYGESGHSVPVLGHLGDPPNLSVFSGSPKPFLGEFDSDFNRFGDPWPGAGTTLERLQLLEREGCELALLWPDFAGGKDGRVKGDDLKKETLAQDTNDVIKLQPATRQAIVAYTGGVLPPAGE